MSEQQSRGPAVADRPRLSMSERPRKSFSAAAAAAAAAEARKSFSASVDLTKIVPKQQQQQKLQQQGNAARVENSTEKESAVDARGQDQERSPASPLPKQLLMPVLPVATVDAIMSASDVRSDNANLGPYLVKLAKSFAAGENPAKALEYGKRAVSFYEKYMDTDGNTCLDLVVSLHILAALHCRLGQYEEGVPLLERSVQLPDVAKGGEEHALAKFAGHMQLGDTLNLMGKQASALESYHAALALQKNMLGDLDPRVGETCHYIAEAHLQAMEFQEAENLCQHALAIHQECSELGCLEEAADRQLLALVFSASGDHDKALENLVHASASLQANGLQVEVAAVHSSIGDEQLALGRNAEAVLSYQKSLTGFKVLKGEDHTSVAAVYVSLADLYLRSNKPSEAKSYCESALRIYGKQGAGHAPEDVADGLTDIAAILEQLNEKEYALRLLKDALGIQASIPGQQASVSGIEAQMGILYNMMDEFTPALDAFNSAAKKLKEGGMRKTALLGMLLNQMGVACIEVGDIEQAAGLFQEAKSVLEETCGPHHLDTIDVSTNLAGSYDALGRVEDAIKLLEEVVEIKEEKLGTVHPDVHNDQERLQQLLKDVGRTYIHKTRKLEELLLSARNENHRLK